ncbi:hypothetical protein LXL04_035176 [Taraxacum kok-saghyz]
MKKNLVCIEVDDDFVDENLGAERVHDVGRPEGCVAWAVARGSNITEMKMVKENMKQMKQETPILLILTYGAKVLLILTYGAISIMAQILKQEAQLHKVAAKSKVGDGSAILKSKVGDRDAVEDDPYLRFKADDEGYKADMRLSIFCCRSPIIRPTYVITCDIFPISPKPLFISKNRLRDPPKRS